MNEPNEPDENEITPFEEKHIKLGSMEASTPLDVVNRAVSISDELAKLIRDKKLSSNISGKNYVRVEGWSTLGAMLGIVPREVSVIEQGNGDFEATVELIRASDGAIVGRGSAILGADEKNWADRPRYAKRSMAITRATGKAFRLGFSWIMALAGYEPTPAEEMIEGEFVDKTKQSMNNQKRSTKKNGDNNRPLDPETLKRKLHKTVEEKYAKSKATDKQRSLTAMLLSQIFQDDEKRHELQFYLFGHESLNDVEDSMILAVLDWLEPWQDDGGAYCASEIAEQEAQAAHTEALRIAGQMDLL